MMDKGAYLPAFMRECTNRKLEWGRFDCGLWLADWWMFLHPAAADPASGIRGQYGSTSGARSLLGPGYVASAVNRIAKELGLARTSEPEPGDIGVVRIPLSWAERTDARPTAAQTIAGDLPPPLIVWAHVGSIKTRRGWALLAKEGGIIGTPNVILIRAWRL